MKPANINTLETVITAYTNGSCQDRSGSGGWGVYAIANDGTVYEYSGKEGGGPTLLDSLAAQLRCIPVADHAANILFITSCCRC